MTNQLPEQLITGVEAVDKQHLTLIITIESILENLDSEYINDEVSNLLDFLVSYTDKHFKTEEKLMLEKNYPDYEHHKSEHDLFRMKIQSLDKSNAISPDNAEIIKSAVTEARDWVISHVMNTDIKMAQFLTLK